MTTALPPLSKDFIVRAPIMEELEAITNLIITCDIADVGEPDFTSDDLLSDWQRPNFNLVTDTRVILTPAGQIVGYTDVYQGRTGMFINPNTNVIPTIEVKAWRSTCFASQSQTPDNILPKHNPPYLMLLARSAQLSKPVPFSLKKGTYQSSTTGVWKLN